MNQPNFVDNDCVVSLEYTVSVGEDVVEASEDGVPLQFIQGHGQVLPGLEHETYGMTPGESKSFQVDSSEGYGEIDPEAFSDIPKNDFPSEIPLEPGIELQMKDKDGEELQAVIASVNAEIVRLDFNHPLAGNDLDFSIKVVAIRHATREELEHGHVHQDS